MKIGVDFDDVLLDCNTSLALFHNSHYGTSYKREDIKSWYLESTWGCTQEEVIARIKEWYRSPEHAQSLPIAGAIEAISKLASHNELHVITSRPAQTRELTQTWLDKYFPGQFSEIHFTNHFEIGARSKADICSEVGVSILIEDALVHARNVAADGIPVLLLDSPWNQEHISKNITRIFTWQDALDFIASFKTPAI